MNEKITALNRSKKNLETISLFLAVAGLLCIFCIFKFRPVGGALFFAIAIFYIFVFRRMVRRYRDQIKAAMIEEGLRPFLKKISYTPKNALDGIDICFMHIVPVLNRDKVLVRDTVRGTYQAMPVVLSDLTCDYEAAPSGKKNSVDYLSGCVLDVELPQDIDAAFTLMPKDMLSEYARSIFFDDWKENLYVGDLAKNYLLYSDPNYTYHELPEEFAKAVLRLAEYTPGQVTVQLYRNHLRIFIRNRFLYTYTFLLRTEITSRLLSTNPLPELPYMLRVVDACLKL